MNLQARIQAFTQLGKVLNKDFYNQYEKMINHASITNSWFTIENIKSVLQVWSKQLTGEMLTAWLKPYNLTESKDIKNILVIMAGNIPLVGFHDLLTVLISGNKVVIKMSTHDNVILPIIIDELISIDPRFKDHIAFIEEVKNKQFDGVIATGSDNSAQYFESYFKGVKKIIRKNRRSVAILDGSESKEELEGLAYDVFSYFGLGCRNVSKLFLPKGFNLDLLFQAFYPYAYVVEHKKYGNNYDYNKAIFLMGNNQLIENGFLILKEDRSLLSPVAMLYYEYYTDRYFVDKFIKQNAEKLQCVVSKQEIPFGHTQEPNLWDYADGVDTIEFLRTI